MRHRSLLGLQNRRDAGGDREQALLRWSPPPPRVPGDGQVTPCLQASFPI